MTETALAAIVPAALALAGVIYSRTVDRRSSSRADALAARVADAELRAKDASTVATEVATLREVLEQLRQAVRDCHTERAEDRTRYAEQIAKVRTELELELAADRRRCDREIGELRRRIATLSAAAGTIPPSGDEDDDGVSP